MGICRYCLEPGTQGIFLFKGKDGPILVCDRCDQDIRYRSLTENYHDLQEEAKVS
jgi:hypothetical protein